MRDTQDGAAVAAGCRRLSHFVHISLVIVIGQSEIMYYVLLVTSWSSRRDWYHRNWCTFGLPLWYVGQSRHSQRLIVVDIIGLLLWLRMKTFCLVIAHGWFVIWITCSFSLFLIWSNVHLTSWIVNFDCATTALKLRCCLYREHSTRLWASPSCLA